MNLTPAQYPALKALIAGDSQLNAFPNNTDGAAFIADALDAISSPDFWVWRTSVPASDMYNNTSDIPSVWDWNLYKVQSPSEQGAWVQMGQMGIYNFALPQIRGGISKIFTGSAQQNAQAAHCLAIGRRKATRAEKLYGVGTGSTATPATMAFEGKLTYQDVDAARNS